MVENDHAESDKLAPINLEKARASSQMTDFRENDSQLEQTPGPFQQQASDEEIKESKGPVEFLGFLSQNIFSEKNNKLFPKEQQQEQDDVTLERASLLKPDKDLEKTSEVQFATFKKRGRRDQNLSQYNSEDALIVGSEPFNDEPQIDNENKNGAQKFFRKRTSIMRESKVTSTVADKFGSSQLFKKSSTKNFDAPPRQKTIKGFSMSSHKNQSFFKDLRTQQTMKSQAKDQANQGPEAPILIEGQKFVESMIKQHAQSYEKKYPFERGQYHQCIPNPKNPNQRITVQLVARVLDEVDREQLDFIEVKKQFAEDQFSKNDAINNLTQQYERYNLIMPQQGDQFQDQGEAESSDSVDLDSAEELQKEQRSRVDKKFDAKSIVMGNMPSFIASMVRNSVTSNANLKVQQLTAGKKAETTQYGVYEAKLYTEKSLFKDVDQLLGVQSKHYADIGISKSNRLVKSVRQDCKEFAVVAFWDLLEADLFKCNRFFIIPNPVKRMVAEVDGTETYQVLLESQHTKDVFFFWKGFKSDSSSDLNQDLGEDSSDDFDIQEEFKISFVELELSAQEINSIGEIRNIESHCKENIPVKKKSILEVMLKQMHERPLKEQGQLPNPTIIDKVAEINQPINEQSLGKCIVFTAFLLEDQVSYNYISGANPVTDSWYPTTYFYDVYRQRVVWEIFGASQFISKDKQSVTVLTNEVWSKITKEQFIELKRDEGAAFSRHNHFSSYIKNMTFGAKTNEEDLENVQHQAPEQPSIHYYRLNFNKNKNLSITEPYKVASPYMNKDQRRVTLLYKDLGAFTFHLKKAESLTNLTLWQGKFLDRNFSCNLRVAESGLKVKGEGVDDQEEKVEIKVELRPRKKADWTGYFETSELTEEITIENLDISDNKIEADWQDEADGTYYSIRGQLGKKSKNHQKIDFYLIFGDKKCIFDGKIDLLRNDIHGKCSMPGEQRTNYKFSFQKAEHVPGKLRIRIGFEETLEREIVMDYQSKKILSAPGCEQEVEIMAIEAVDQAVLIYSILQQDVNYLQYNGNCYIQAKITAIIDDRKLNQGNKFAVARGVLYNIDAPLKKEKDTNNTLASVPEEKIRFLFYSNSSLLKAQAQKLLWQVEPSIVSYDESGQPRLFGAALYEQRGAGTMKLNMFSAELVKTEKVTSSFSQQPVQQSWIVDYPLLAYKTFSPRNKEIAIMNMVHNMQQRVIHLGEWEFVCFVNHTQMVEQRCFMKEKETNCNIMILVKRDNVCRLMSYKSNPWISYNKVITKDEDQDICKHSLFIFSGEISLLPTEDEDGKAITKENEDYIKYQQRFSSDKVQSCQLITKPLNRSEQFMLIIQFSDCIVRASLNNSETKVIYKSENMIKRHLVRGYNEKVFFAEQVGNVQKIQQLEFHPTKANEIIKKEIYQLTGGKLVAFENNDDNMQNDVKEEVTQSFFIIDDQQKVYLLQNEDNIKYQVKQVIDFSRHNNSSQLLEAQNDSWAHVHVSERALTLSNMTYNLRTQLQQEICVPRTYFGQISQGREVLAQSSIDSEQSQSSSSSSDSEDEKDEDNWRIVSAQGMLGTNNMILVAQKDQREFCFVVKPAPGSRKLSIVGSQQAHEIQQMLFISNLHVLVSFKGGKVITLLANGSLIHQQTRVQDLLDSYEKIICESQIFQGKKTVLFEDIYYKDQNDEKVRHMILQFNEEGIGEVQGIFYDFTTQVLAKMNQLSKHIVMKHHIRYAKEWFITERGEVVKIAAIVTPFDKIRSQLKAQADDDNSKNKRKKKNKKSDSMRKHFISIVKVDSSQASKSSSMVRSKSLRLNESLTYQEVQGKQEKGDLFTLIVFHTLTVEMQIMFAQQTQYCLVGNYLCHRHRKNQRKTIWVTKLKKNEVDLIQKEHIQVQDEIKDKDGLAANTVKKYASQSLSIKSLASKDMTKHIQFTEVPKAFFTTIKSRDQQGVMQFHDNLLQITIGSHGIHFDLDTRPIKEARTIENIDQFMNPHQFVNTGFIMQVAFTDKGDEITFNRRRQLFVNELSNLMFERSQIRYDDGRRETNITGLLYKSFTEIDLQELQQISQALNSRSKISEIDEESIVTNFESHTIFSIFFDRIQVYERILCQLQEKEFEGGEILSGLDAEDSYIRRLYRILNKPTGDLKHFKQNKWLKDEKNQILSVKKNPFMQIYSKCKKCLEKEPSQGEKGFKSILMKSLHNNTSLFREDLIEMALLCGENSIDDFVDNLADLEILFNSFSPSEQKLFDKPFKKTRFTEQIKNADWKIGDNLEVIGRMSSVIKEKEANDQIKKRQKKFFQSENDIQNMQVEAKMLQIDWVFKGFHSKKTSGFADFVVILSNSPYETLYSTDFVQALVEHFWTRYRRSLLRRCFVPFVIYFISTLIYISNYVLDGIDTEDVWSRWSSETLHRFIVIILNIYFLYFEIRSMIRDGFPYFFDIFNYVDLLGLMGTMYLMQNTLKGKKPEEDQEGIVKAVAAITVVLTWCKSFYWLRLFSSTSFYVRLVQETLWDMKFFLILFVLTMMTFGNALMILNHGREEPLYEKNFSVDFSSVLLNQYIMSMGEFDTDGRFRNLEQGGDVQAWVIFILATLITHVTFLNMLIAIMGDTFARVTETREQSAFAEKIRIMSDYVFVVPQESESKGTMNRFLFSIRPKALSAEEHGSWQGNVSMLKESVEQSVTKAIKTVNGKIGQIQGEFAESYKKIGVLEERISELKFANEEQHNLIQTQKSMLQNQGASIEEILGLIRDQGVGAAAAASASNASILSNSPDKLNMTKKKLKEILQQKRYQRPEVEIVPDNEEF